MLNYQEEECLLCVTRVYKLKVVTSSRLRGGGCDQFILQTLNRNVLTDQSTAILMFSHTGINYLPLTHTYSLYAYTVYRC